MKYIAAFLSFFIIGCGSTPYRDDYTQHVNNLGAKYLKENEFRFSLPATDNVDLRGMYNADDTTDNTPILYQGGAGIAGLLVQIGAHTSMINSQRSSLLSQQQEEANTRIEPLFKLSQKIALSKLLGSESAYLAKDKGDGNLEVTPVFFSNASMDELFLNAIVVLPFEKTRKIKKPRYRNLIKVYSQKLDPEQQQVLLEDNGELLSRILSKMLSTAIAVVRNDITGKYTGPAQSVETHILNTQDKRIVIRGVEVDKSCGYTIVRDIHSWFVVIPKEELLTALAVDPASNCQV